MRLTGSGSFVDRFQAHLRHQSPDAMPPDMGVDAARILDAHADAFVEGRYMHEMTRGSFSHSDMESVLASVLKLFRARHATKTITPFFDR